jgi:hypothetical protein
MSNNKNWQCPHCSRCCSGRGNLVVHIRRKHGGVGQPIDKENTSSSNLNGTHINRRPSASSYNSNRSSIDYSNQASKDNGDMIDEMHQMLTEMEKRRRKLEEIIEIFRKYQPFPIQTLYTDVSNATIKDMEKIVPQKIPSQDKPHSLEVPVQTHNYRIAVTGQKSKTEKAPQDLPLGKNREKEWWLNRTEYLVDPNGDEWDVNVPPKITWVRKLNLFGDIIDMYQVLGDPIEELQDLSKRWWKNNTLYQ